MTALPREPERGTCGDEDKDAAFSCFYTNSLALLVARCIRIGVPQSDAPSIAQDLMLEIYRRWSSIECPEAYANRVIAHRAVGFLEMSSRVSNTGDTDPGELGQPLTTALPDGTLAVDGEHLVLQALDQLPTAQRAVFALTFDGFTCADIAGILGWKEATVRSHLRHAREKLRTWRNRINPSQSEEGGA